MSSPPVQFEHATMEEPDMASKLIRGVKPNLDDTAWGVAKLFALSLGGGVLLLIIYVGGIFLLASAVK